MTISVLWWSTSTATVSAATPGSSILAATAPAPLLTFTHPTHNLIRAELHVVGWAVFGYPLAGELQLHADQGARTGVPLPLQGLEMYIDSVGAWRFDAGEDHLVLDCVA